jgi:hypothetical protein
MDAAARYLRTRNPLKGNPMSTRMAIAALIYMMVNAVVFGIGAVTVLSIPSLSENATIWLPAVVVTSFILSAPLAWYIAPRMRSRAYKATH